MKNGIKWMLVLLLCLMLGTAHAQTNVYAAITDDKGEIVMGYDAVQVTDADGDGTLTIHDALSCAHAQYYHGGVEGYNAVETEWGLSLMELWGVENGGSYGYYLNDSAAMSLKDPVKDGDFLKAYAFTDLETWSDTYSFFDKPVLSVKAGEAFELTLLMAAFDENFAPVTLPVENATILVADEPADVVTDAQGKASVVLAQPGTYLLSARCEGVNLVPPVCLVVVQE